MAEMQLQEKDDDEEEDEVREAIFFAKIHCNEQGIPKRTIIARV